MENIKNNYVNIKDINKWNVNMIINGRVQVGWKVYQLENGQEMEANGYIVMVINGIVQVYMHSVNMEENKKKVIIVGGNQWFN